MNDAEQIARRRGLRSRQFQRGNHSGRTMIWYRCVYCRRQFSDRFKLPAHEAQCDARVLMERIWATVIARAKQREIRDRKGSEIR